MSLPDFFDANYVQTQKTEAIVEKESTIKDFLKTPIEQSDIKKYGSSKPQRTIIRASLKNG